MTKIVNFMLHVFYNTHTKELVLLNQVPCPQHPAFVPTAAGVDVWPRPMACACWTLYTLCGYCASDVQVLGPQSGPGPSTLTLGPSAHTLPQHTVKSCGHTATKSVRSLNIHISVVYSIIFLMTSKIKNHQLVWWISRSSVWILIGQVTSTNCSALLS